MGVLEAWGPRLGLSPAELDERLTDAVRGGEIGTVALDDVHQALRDRLGLDEQRLAEFMADVWRQYLGTANSELIEYVRGLRPRYRTGILSNSFVGARERERAAYGFEETIFVDDVGRNVTAAREAGLHAICYQHNAQAIAAIGNLL